MHRMSQQKQQLACLYTKHKTQKRKVWQDGRLVLNANSSKAILHDADPPPGSGDPSLGECEISPGQIDTILRQYCGQNRDTTAVVGSATIGLLETERYLIEIEGPWTNSSNPSISAPPASHLLKRPLSGKKAVSSSMKKLLASKFQKPKSYVPPPPGTQRSRMEKVLGKRRRPLQPGELVARHYGGGNGNSIGGNGVGFDDQRNNFNHQHQQDHRREHHSLHGRGNISDNRGRGPPLYRAEIQPHGVEQPPVSTETPIGSMNPSFRSPEASNSLVTYSGAGVSRSAGPAASTDPQHFRRQQQQRVQRPAQQRRNNAVAFVQNEFDSARYYGTEEEEEDDEEESSSPRQSAQFGQTLMDRSRGEQQQKGSSSSSDIQTCDNRRNRTIGEDHVGDSIQRVDHIHQEETELLNPRHCHQDQCLSSSATSAPVSSRNPDENGSKTKYSNNNDRRSISKVGIEQQSKPHKDESNLNDRDQHRKKHLDEDEDESEEDDEDLSDDDFGAPVSFRLKPTESLVGTNKEKKDATSSSMSGNRLLALFGAGFNEPIFGNSKNSDRSNKMTENGRINERSDIDKENSILNDGSGGARSRRSVGNLNEQLFESNTDVEKDKQTHDEKKGKEKQQDNHRSFSGFYLPPAATSSEESSADESSDGE